MVKNLLVDFTATRFLHTIETFVLIFVTTMFAQNAVSGQSFDLTTKAGQTAFLSAALAAAYLALRRVLSLGDANAPTGTTGNN